MVQGARIGRSKVLAECGRRRWPGVRPSGIVGTPLESMKNAEKPPALNQPGLAEREEDAWKCSNF